MYKKTILAERMTATGLQAFDLKLERYQAPAIDQTRKTARNPLQQREAYYAAEAKRERKQMKRLADSGQSGEELL